MGLCSLLVFMCRFDIKRQRKGVGARRRGGGKGGNRWEG